MPRLFLRVLSDAIALDNETGEVEGYDIGVEWLVQENDGSVRDSGITDYRGLADLTDPHIDWLGHPDSTVIFVPSEHVLTINCEVPGRNMTQIRQALPFAVEEFVATDIESMHIAHAPIKAGEPVQCSLLERNLLSRWLACFKSLSIRPGFLVSDAEVLDRKPGTASALIDGETVLVADHAQAATVDRANLVFALNSLPSERLVVVNGLLGDLEKGQLEHNPDIEEVLVDDHGVLAYLANRFTDSTFVNLLQGEFQPPKRHSTHSHKWRSVMAIAAVWALVGFLGLIVQGWRANSEADRLEAEGLAFYQQIFPQERNQPSSLAQLQRNVNAKLRRSPSGERSSDFVGLTAQFSNAIKPTDLVQSLNFTDQRGEVTVEVMLDTYDDLETIKSKLGSSGVVVEVASAEQEEKKVRSRLRMRYQ